MQTDILVIGQGICGSFLSWYLQKAGHSCLVIDEEKDNTASRVAAGIINPITGRRLVKTWMIDDLLPFAWEAYTTFEQELGITAIRNTSIVDFFPTAQMRNAFVERVAEEPFYLSLPQNEQAWAPWFQYELGFGQVHPCYLIYMADLLAAWRRQLEQQQAILAEHFDHTRLHITATGIRYKDITAQYIIFCDGVASYDNPLFPNLPFAPNKGQALWVRAANLPCDHLFKKGINLVPWKDDLYWVGASYEWDFENDQPDPAFRERMEQNLRHWLKTDFEVVDHKASLRPANMERRPFVGLHPAFPRVGMLNGMGTKGCSLAPYFAHQLTRHLSNGTPITPIADVARFKKTLNRL